MSDHRPTAVVLGGSLAGLLAARALSAGGARVTVVERDALPAGPEPRKGLPQARHVHQLWSGGARALEELLPGAIGRLRAAGVSRVPMTTDMVALSPYGWYRRWSESAFMLPASRDLTDWVVRQLVLADGRIELVERAEATGLTGTERAVTGVRVRADDHTVRTLPAGLVVDATGRGSRAVRWLTGLGLPAVERREVDSGLVYASRLFRAPEQARHGFPIVSVEPDPRGAGTGRGGVLMPVEDGKWIVTLFGGRGDEPPSTGAEFARYAREELRHPLIGELLGGGAEPLGEVAVTRTTANRRHYFERMPAWPENFVVVGDAVCALNPLYGHGMAVAARSARVLGEVVRRQGLGRPGLARDVQKEVGRTVRAAWDLAVGADVFYPGATEKGPTLRDRVMAAYVGRLLYTATGNGRVARRVTDVTALERGAETLLSPSVALAAAVGPLKRPLAAPPLTARERRAAGV
ncbi:FAD-dependent oxidoreductase [Streptomyces actinomycinicus]|uniref:FAD-dependent oxidoreductase n=1 Tax=Streptomyces actinomycinicus TaxID=1695166 RepID=A0A937EEY6_9ACTN|nr:FAD-dependent oxidoreductase [Streptomyces actinomycinicus]MBL1080900.1 FAD-dependent oxidoreductase [Streptomyces actinomycinicus]